MQKRLWISIALAAICCYFAFRGISFIGLVRSFAGASKEWIFAALMLYLLNYYLRAIRWSIFLKDIKKIEPPALWGPLMIGFLANNILPFRMGELVRAQVTGVKFKISRTASLGTILLERLFDTVSFLTTFILAAFYCHFPPLAKKGAITLAISCFAVVVCLFLLSRNKDRFLTFMRSLSIPQRHKNRIDDFVVNFVHGTTSMRRPDQAALALISSLIIWSFEGLFLFLVARAFHLNLGFAQSFFLLFFLGLSVTLPQAPGYVGTLELFGTTALLLIGIPKASGLPVILAIHGLQFTFVCAVGGLALWQEGLSIGNLMAMKIQEDPLPIDG